MFITLLQHLNNTIFMTDVVWQNLVIPAGANKQNITQELLLVTLGAAIFDCQFRDGENLTDFWLQMECTICNTICKEGKIMDGWMDVLFHFYFIGMNLADALDRNRIDRNVILTRYCVQVLTGSCHSLLLTLALKLFIVPSFTSEHIWQEAHRVRALITTVLWSCTCFLSGSDCFLLSLLHFLHGYFNAKSSRDQSLPINQDHTGKSLKGEKILYLKHYYT